MSLKLPETNGKQIGIGLHFIFVFNILITVIFIIEKGKLLKRNAIYIQALKIFLHLLCFQYTYWMTLIQIGGKVTTKEERDCSQLTLSHLTCQLSQRSLVSNQGFLSKL